MYSLYKKALKTKKKEVTYIVAKKGAPNRRPTGVKGKYKMVDGRMKKDNLRKKASDKIAQKKRKGPKPQSRPAKKKSATFNNSKRGKK